MFQTAFKCSFQRLKNILYRLIIFIVYYIAIKIIIKMLSERNKTFIIYHMEQYMKYFTVMAINSIRTAFIIIVFVGDKEHIDFILRYLIDGGIIVVLFYYMHCWLDIV